MLTSFPGGVLMHQDEHIEGVRSFSGQFHLQRMSLKRDTPSGSGMCNLFAPKCPCLGELRPWACYLAVNCSTSLFCLSFPTPPAMEFS